MITIQFSILTQNSENCYYDTTGIRPDLAKDQFSPLYIFLQDKQTEIQNTNCKNIDGVPISDFGQGDNSYASSNSM